MHTAVAEEEHGLIKKAFCHFLGAQRKDTTNLF
jgi:hypothetical protein